MFKIKLFIAKIVFGLQTLLYAIKANIEKRHYKNNFVFFVLTPNHVNYGDQALALAGSEILKDYHVFEITGDLLSRFINYPRLLKFLFGKEAIVFQGGGYLGTFWFDYGERLLRAVLEAVPDNKILVLPQSIYYSDDEFGKAELEKSKRIYAGCSKLTLAARDKISYALMKQYYGSTNIVLIPDIVLYLNKCDGSPSRNGAMLTLRNDLETNLDDSFRFEIEQFAKTQFSTVTKVDMLAESSISPKQRKTELEKQFGRFKSAELVITDRLHGMIFSAITGTPCIVLGSKSHKVKGVYDWVFADCPYIIFTDDFSEMEAFAASVKGKKFKYDNSGFIQYFDDLKKLIKKAVYK